MQNMWLEDQEQPLEQDIKVVEEKQWDTTSYPLDNYAKKASSSLRKWNVVKDGLVEHRIWISKPT